jgi:hypothetical protein
MDEKFSVLFWTEFSIGELKFQVKVCLKITCLVPLSVSNSLRIMYFVKLLIRHITCMCFLSYKEAFRQKKTYLLLFGIIDLNYRLGENNDKIKVRLDDHKHIFSKTLGTNRYFLRVISIHVLKGWDVTIVEQVNPSS